MKRGILGTLAAASALLLLAGCMPTASAPPKMSVDAAKKMIMDGVPSQWENVNSMLTTPQPLPELPPITLVGGDDWANDVNQCIARAGFSQYYDYVNGTQLQVSTNSRTDAAMVSNFVCQVQYSYDPRPYSFTARQMTYLYDYYEHWLIPCLELRANPVDDVPNKTQFVQDGGYWNPYISVTPGSSTADHKAFAALQRACPSYPGGLLISNQQYPVGG